MAPSLDLNRLSLFQEVVLAGSFTKAAAKLRQPKSRISRQMAALEKELGVQLVYRTTRQFQLTTAGRDLFEKTKPLLTGLNDTLEEVSTGSEEVSGPIRMSVPEDIGVELMGDICSEFMSLYPTVKIELHVDNRMVDLVKESFDLAIRIGELKDSTMTRKKIGHTNTSLVMSPKLREIYGEPKEAKDIEKIPFLGFAALVNSGRALKLSSGKHRQSIKPQPIFVSTNLFVLRNMAVRGRGIAFMPLFMVREQLAQNTLIPVLPEWTIEGRPIQIVMPQQKEPPRRMKKFVDFLIPRLAPYFN